MELGVCSVNRKQFCTKDVFTGATLKQKKLSTGDVILIEF